MKHLWLSNSHAHCSLRSFDLDSGKEQKITMQMSSPGKAACIQGAGGRDSKAFLLCCFYGFNSHDFIDLFFFFGGGDLMR